MWVNCSVKTLGAAAAEDISSAGCAPFGSGTNRRAPRVRACACDHGRLSNFDRRRFHACVLHSEGSRTDSASTGAAGASTLATATIAGSAISVDSTTGRWLAASGLKTSDLKTSAPGTSTTVASAGGGRDAGAASTATVAASLPPPADATVVEVPGAEVLRSEVLSPEAASSVP